jgi:hypothetical protein
MKRILPGIIITGKMKKSHFNLQAIKSFWKDINKAITGTESKSAYLALPAFIIFRRGKCKLREVYNYS